MPLTLVTGPANSAKAGWVLGAFREALDRAAGGGRLAAPEPLLVVPTAADVEPYQRELAASGTVFGGEVVTFSGLIREIARRAGYGARVLAPIARERVVAATVRDARLQALGGSAGTPGFVEAAGRLFAELQRSLVSPARLRAAVRAWAAQGDASAHAEEVAGLYSSYLRRLERLGAVDAEGFAWAALDALRAQPAAWGGSPVFLYGFDDLTAIQRDALETLVRVVGAEVTVSLPYERGRAAFAGRAATVEALRPLAEADGAVVELPDRSEHYRPRSRLALHHLERHLFEDAAPRVAPNGAVRLLEAGGERAEAELAGAAVLELLRDGVAPADVAVLVPAGADTRLLEQVLEGLEIPVAREARAALGRTRLGAGLLAFARCATDPDASAEDLLRWLRTPGKLRRPELADELEARVRRAGVATGGEAAGVWASLAGSPLHELPALAAAARAGAGPFLDGLEAELERMWIAPHRRRAPVFGAEAAEDARLVAAVRLAASELRRLAAEDARLVRGAADALAALERLEVRADPGTAGGVLVADAAAVRARRFRAVLLLGLQEADFPRRPVPEPFLGDDDRRALARAGGLLLPLHEDVIARERHLFYAAISRAEEVLYLSFRTCDEEGEPQLPSPFVDDVRALFTDELWVQRGRRLLAEVTWPPAQAPTPLELRRAMAARSPGPDPEPLREPATAAALERLAARELVSATDLERFAGCGVSWFVQSLLRPRRIDPDPEPMRRGSLAHAVLERTLAGLKERTGSARLSPDRREAAARELRAALAEVPADGAAQQAALRALEADLWRWLDAECEADTGMEPAWLEWGFGRDGDAHPPLELEGLRITGRVDRVDVAPGGAALVRDYKNSTAAPAAKWLEESRLQGALYAAAAKELLGLEPVGAVYQPLAGPDLRPRGAVQEGAPGAQALVANDVLPAQELEALMAELRAASVRVAAEMRAGRIAACPERCTPKGCAFPGICRAREVDA